MNWAREIIYSNSWILQTLFLRPSYPTAISFGNLSADCEAKARAPTTDVTSYSLQQQAGPASGGSDGVWIGGYLQAWQ